MNLAIDKKVNKNQLNELEFLVIYKGLKIYQLEESAIFFIAIDNKGLVCSCFEFHEIDDQYRLAHMDTTLKMQGQGIGKAIMKEAVEVLDFFELPSTNSSDYYHYIEFGQSFIESCFRDGILKNPFRHPNRSI